MNQRLVAFETVRQLVGKSRTTLWRWEQEGKFPQRVQLGANSIGWILEEVLDWIAARAAARPANGRGVNASRANAAIAQPSGPSRAWSGRGYAQTPVPTYYRRGNSGGVGVATRLQ